MRVSQLILTFLALVGFAAPAAIQAHVGPDSGRPANRSTQERISFRTQCDNAVAQIDMQVNNVRARLTTGGDVWWDGNDGRYVVPKPPPGVPEVSSIFAGAVWLGGQDPGGGLKVAAQQYGRGGGNFDYYPGPLTDDGSTSKDTCARWDRFFVVSGESIRELQALYNDAVEGPGSLPLDVSDIPSEILAWPATGNPYFFEENGFELPNTTQGFAGFWDQDLDGIYDPTFGDYPIIEIRGCNETPQFPEEMIFWIYNDAGDVHRESGTPTPIQMEIQVQAFAYTTSDDINSMTFQRYKLINRAQEDILNTYFAMWVDPDLGCFTDDFVGSDTLRDMVYVYNEDELDGANGCTCTGGVNTYCDEIPILGVDYFRGPIAPIYGPNGDVIDEELLGMSSFIYINNAGVGNPPPPTTDPNTADEYYNYLQGRWLDGSPLFNTGNGFDQAGSEETRYAFYDAPNDPSGWSMVTAALPFGDRRTLQASGPFTLRPGTVNELIIGVVWVPDQTYPNPSIQRLQQADDLAQSLFDNCFDICDGPDAPDLDVVELDREIILLLSNAPSSNNADEDYSEAGLGIPDSIVVDGEVQFPDSLYRFEGYRIFQFSGPDVTLADIDDPERVREIAKFDLNNGITDVFNWTPVEEEDNSLGRPYLVPKLVASGTNSGIRKSIRITQDAFASGDETRLINHQRYYFAAIAYGYNNYFDYDPFNTDQLGQPQQYKASSRNIGDRETGNAYYTVIPRPILDRTLMAEYGDGAIITRISGQGNNGNFLDLTEEETEEIEASFASGELVNPELTYQEGAGPIDIQIYDPRNIQNGDYELTFFDDDMTNDELEEGAMWMLRCLDGCSEPTIISERAIESRNEQLVNAFGFSVSIGQVAEPGDEPENGNGAIGSNLTYENEDGPQWLSFLPDEFDLGGAFPLQVSQELYNYVNTDFMEAYEALDPNGVFNSWAPGVYPYMLMDHSERASQVPFISPVWVSRTNGSVRRFFDLADLRNVDIVFTANKDLWTRCPVVETANDFYEDVVVEGEPVVPSGFPAMFDTRDAPSVTKEAGSDPNTPAVEANPNPDLARGMGYFPGYAVDVETGERLQIFWGENSLYDGRQFGSFTAQSNGADMVWNPSDVVFDPVPGQPNFFSLVSGGQHFFYVMNRVYDEGEFLESRLEPRTNGTRKVSGIRDVLYAGFPLLTPGTSLLSYADGIVPNEARLKLRVDNKFEYAEGTDDSNGYPTYRFSISDKAADTEATEASANRQLDMINVVPNPYYGFSNYEDSQFETNIKITNLPARATVTIYSLDGKFIRKYERDEVPAMLRNPGMRPVGTRQISPALEWDLKNFRNIPVSGGVYLIHVSAPGLGERTLKFFGVQRQFDPSGL